MLLNTAFYSAWFFRRHFWLLASCFTLIASFFYAVFALQIIAGAFLAFTIASNIWNYFTFKEYKLSDERTNLPRTWQEIVKEFETNSHRLAFNHVSRDSIAAEIKSIIEDKKLISQSSNNLCGAIAFLNFLSQHNPELFAKTICEYFENGSTRSPFYLQSSIWDRWLLFVSTTILKFSFHSHYGNCGEALAGAFKNTYNLFGYNALCWLEHFKGATRPLRIQQWLALAGYECENNIVLKNYNNNSEVPLFFRFLLGGVYGNNEQLCSDGIKSQAAHAYILLEQSSGGTPIHYMFNVGDGHWTLHNGSGVLTSNHIKVRLK